MNKDQKILMKISEGTVTLSDKLSENLIFRRDCPLENFRNFTEKLNKSHKNWPTTHNSTFILHQTTFHTSSSDYKSVEVPATSQMQILKAFQLSDRPCDEQLESLPCNNRPKKNIWIEGLSIVTCSDNYKAMSNWVFLSFGGF